MLVLAATARSCAPRSWPATPDPGARGESGRIGFLAEAEAEPSTPCSSTSSAKLPRRTAHDPRRPDPGRRRGDLAWLGAQRGQSGEGPRLGCSAWSWRSTAGRCRPSAATVCWCRARPGPPRTHSRRGPGGVAGSGGHPGRAQQRPRAVRPSDGDQPQRDDRDRDRRRQPRRAGVLRRPPRDDGPGRRAARGDQMRHPAEVGSAGQRPFTDRLVRKFRLPVTGWRGQ